MAPTTRGARVKTSGDAQPDELSGKLFTGDADGAGISAAIKTKFRARRRLIKDAPLVDEDAEMSDALDVIVKKERKDDDDGSLVEISTQKPKSPKRARDEFEPVLDAKKIRISAENETGVKQQSFQEPLNDAKQNFEVAYNKLMVALTAEGEALKLKVASLKNDLTQQLDAKQKLKTCDDELAATNQKLIATNLEFVTANKTLVTTSKKLEAVVLKQKEKITKNNKKLRQLKSLEKMMDANQEKYDELLSEKQALSEMLEKERVEAEYIKKEYYGCLEELKPDYGDPDKVTDEIIEEKWRAIGFRIENIASGYIKVPETVADNSHFALLVEHCAKQPDMEHFLVERFLWGRVYSDIFQAKNGLWGGSVGEMLVETIDRMSRANKDNAMNLSLISRMKFKAGKDIDMDVGSNKEVLSKAIDKLWDDLKVLAPEGKHEHLKQSITVIMTNAAELTVIMARSRAIFTFGKECLEPSQGPLTFDPERMIIAHTDHWRNQYDDRAKAVLFASPFLEKIGTADGDKFECRYTIGKARVVVRHERKEGDAEEVFNESPDDSETETDRDDDPVEVTREHDDSRPSVAMIAGDGGEKGREIRLEN